MAKLFLAGDVMTGRGIDQVLRYPGNPQLFEEYITAATDYVYLAELAHGPIGKPVDFAYVWGDALPELSRQNPYPGIINLETAITRSKIREPKGINYKMNPDNIPVLTAAGIDCCVLANNHVLDWGEQGLRDTLVSLDEAGIKVAGAGWCVEEASAPAIMEASPACRVLVFGLGATDSGVFPHWAASVNRPGVRLLPDLSRHTAEDLAAGILAKKQRGDIVVVSIHWGPNWGYKITREQRAFAHALIDLDACDILHGHSSHHALAIEIYRRRLILYGCGDFINDYEGIEGHERYRGDLSAMYLPRVNEADGGLEALTLVLFQKIRFSLRYASLDDAIWFQRMIGCQSSEFGTRLVPNSDGTLNVEPL